jgi:hypothetical protein
MPAAELKADPLAGTGHLKCDHSAHGRSQRSSEHLEPNRGCDGRE